MTVCGPGVALQGRTFVEGYHPRRRCPSVRAAGREPGNPSALVALDGPGVTDLGGVGVLPELLLGLPLTEEVPALVQLDLQVAQPGMLLGRRDLVGGQLVAQGVLLVDEVGDALPRMS